MDLHLIKTINILILVVFTAVTMSSCDDDLPNENGEHSWRADFVVDQLASSFKPLVFDEFVVYGNDVISGTDWLIAYDKETGDKKWDMPAGSIKNPGTSAYTVRLDEMAFIYTRGTVSALSSNGVIRWSNEIGDGSGERDIVLNEHGLFAYAEVNKHRGVIYSLDLENGNASEVVDYSNDLLLTKISDFQFFTKNNINYLATTVIYVSTDFQTSTDTTYLYEMNGAIELVWKDDISPERIGSYLIDNHNLIFKSDGKYISYDLINRNENWQAEVGSSTAGFIHNNSLYYAETGVAVNSVTNFARRSLATGELEKRSAETYNYPLDGFVNDGENLYAARSGTILQLSLDDFSLQQEYISSDYQNNSNAFFDGAITIDHNTGEMYAANFVAALKFQLIR